MEVSDITFYQNVQMAVIHVRPTSSNFFHPPPPSKKKLKAIKLTSISTCIIQVSVRKMPLTYIRGPKLY